MNLKLYCCPANIATLILGVITGRTKRKQPTTDEVRPKTGETNNCLSDVMIHNNKKMEFNFIEIKEHYLRVGHCSSYNLVSLQYTIEI